MENSTVFDDLPEDDPRRKVSKVISDLEPDFTKLEQMVYFLTVDAGDNIKITSNADPEFLLYVLENYVRKLRRDINKAKLAN